MVSFFQMFFSKIWGLFSIPWPGFNFTIGQAFLGALTSVGAMTMIMKMTGVNPFKSAGSFRSGGGNNRNIKVSESRKGDTK